MRIAVPDQLDAKNRFLRMVGVSFAARTKTLSRWSGPRMSVASRNGLPELFRTFFDDPKALERRSAVDA